MSKRILVVDDEESYCTLLRRLLEGAGFDVSAVQSTDAGVASAESERPQLILLDMQMPGGGGRNVFERLSRNAGTKDIPIIFTTALSLEKVNELIPPAPQCLGYLRKPFDLDFVLERVSRVLT